MNASSKKADVEWNKDGKPVNWNGRDWPLYKRTMMRYLTCYKVEENEWQLDDICDKSFRYSDTNGETEQRTFLRQDLLVAKILSSSLSSTLARQVMRFDYGSDMWEYLAKRFEGRENPTTKLYTQRALRQKLEMTSCRPGADVENHLLYMMNLREQLAAVDADVGDVWMVDLMFRSMSQLSYYGQLQIMMMLGNNDTNTPEQAKALILVMDKNARVEKQLQARRHPEYQAHSDHPNGSNRGGRGGGGRGEQRGGGGRGEQRGGGRGGGRGRPRSNYPNNNPNRSSGAYGSASGNNSHRSEEQQRQYENDLENQTCFGCHKSGHFRRNCPEEMNRESQHGEASGNVRGQANFTVSPSVSRCEHTKFAQETKGEFARNRAQQEVNLQAKKPVYRPEQWVFDNGANKHLVGVKGYFVSYRELTLEESEEAAVHGYNGKSLPTGIGSIDLMVNVDGSHVALRIENVYYSPEKTNLFSQSMATEQGFQVAYDDAERKYTLSMNGEVALQVKMQLCKLWIFTAENGFLAGKDEIKEPPEPENLINYAMQDGVADLQCWHERLGHICPQFVKQMADNSLVDGMMLRKRSFDLYEACQLGKQRAKTPMKKLDRGVKRRNQLICADLFFPPAHYNCTRFKAVLVIIDVQTRFVTAYPVQSKDSPVINDLIRRYVVWAERQWPNCLVSEIITDGGGEFANTDITAWYQQHGITHTTTPKDASRLNMVERTHQTL